MELRQLEYLVAVAEEASFTRAAERVHISQSGVSAQVRRLERELGAELIERGARTATLTAAGEAVLEHARAALAAAGAVRRAVDDVTGVVRGRIALGMVTGCTITPLFDALAAFHRDHPGVEIALVEDTSDVLVAQVAGGELDLALVGTAGAPEGVDPRRAADRRARSRATLGVGARRDAPGAAGIDATGAVGVAATDAAAIDAADAAGMDATDAAAVDARGRPRGAALASQVVISEGLIAAVPAGHPLAGRDRAPLTDVVAHPVVCLPEGTGIRTVFERSCAEAGLTPDVALQASAPDAVADLAVRGLGAAILAASMADGLDDRLHPVAIDGLTVPAVLALVWRKGPHPALRELLVRAREAFGPPVEVA